MQEEVRKDIIQILNQVIIILKSNSDVNSSDIKNLSDHTLHDISTYQDIDSASIAVITYALYKLLERGQSQTGDMCLSLRKELEQAKEALTKKNFGDYNKRIEKSIAIITNTDRQMHRYIQEIMIKARINKGSRLFEHGLSAKRAAKIMGISEWELLGYTGKTQISDSEPLKHISVRGRLLHALKIFGL
jgi:hypothetical protein